MSKKTSKELFEWYAEVAAERLEEMRKEGIDIPNECPTRQIFSDYMLNAYIKYYGLRCTCDDCMDWEFRSAVGHYHGCELWKFCHIVERCLDWAAKHQEVAK